MIHFRRLIDHDPFLSRVLADMSLGRWIDDLDDELGDLLGKGSLESSMGVEVLLVSQQIQV